MVHGLLVGQAVVLLADERGVALHWVGPGLQQVPVGWMGGWEGWMKVPKAFSSQLADPAPPRPPAGGHVRHHSPGPVGQAAAVLHLAALPLLLGRRGRRVHGEGGVGFFSRVCTTNPHN